MTGDRERRIRIECRWARETAVHCVGEAGSSEVGPGEWTEVDGPDVRGEGEGGGDGGGRWCSWSHESFKIVPSLPRKCQADLGRLTSIRLEEATRRQNTVKLSVRWRRFCSAILRKLSQGRSFVGYLAVDGCHQEIAIPSRHSHYHAIQHDTQSSLAVLNHSLGWLPPPKSRC